MESVFNLARAELELSLEATSMRGRKHFHSFIERNKKHHNKVSEKGKLNFMAV